MNKNLLTAAIGILVLIIVGYYYYQFTVRENFPGENKYRMANQYLEDGEYKNALALFDEVIEGQPENKEAILGKAITLMQMNRLTDALDSFNRSIEIDNNFAAAYANRGILNDRMGHYKEAMTDYRKAIALKPELAEGPGWLWRFLHNVGERPSTIADRADYIEMELKKPESERLLRVPEIDAQQRMYKK